MKYDLQSALSAAGKAGTMLGDLSPAELDTMEGQFAAQQARRDRAAVESFQQLEADTQEDHLRALFGF